MRYEIEDYKTKVREAVMVREENPVPKNRNGRRAVKFGTKRFSK